MSEDSKTDGQTPDRASSEAKPGVSRKLAIAAAPTLLQFPTGGGSDGASAPSAEGYRSVPHSFGPTPSGTLEPLPDAGWPPHSGAVYGRASVLEIADEMMTPSSRSFDAAEDVAFGEIFENVPEPLWPIGGAVVVKAAAALLDLRRQSRGVAQDQTTGLTRTSLTSHGTVEIEGEYPGDAVAIGLLSTWLYRFCTGRFPRHDERQVPSQLNSNVPNWIDSICVRGLSHDPDMRYASITQFRDDLEQRVPGVSNKELGSLVRRVLSRLCPTEEALAGELAGALRIITLPPPKELSRSSAWWRSGLAIIVAAAGLLVWKQLFHA
jgi:hypothetical protein